MPVKPTSKKLTGAQMAVVIALQHSKAQVWYYPSLDRVLNAITRERIALPTFHALERAGALTLTQNQNNKLLIYDLSAAMNETLQEGK